MTGKDLNLYHLAVANKNQFVNEEDPTSDLILRYVERWRTADVANIVRQKQA